jgi:hydroxymethylpyrimidine/phosphomethylpyrimidine kinase
MVRPFVLSVAGFDPCGGAGILADIKTFEANKVLGLGVTSAITYQNENNFDGVSWIPVDSIVKQLELLISKYRPKYIKIGLMESMATMHVLTDYLIRESPRIRIIWDPVLKASAGFEFHQHIKASDLELLCRKIYLITPNWLEMERLFPGSEPVDSSVRLAENCIVYLKGGHNIKQRGRDFLFQRGSQFSFRPKVICSYDKHGTGCVFSAALTAYLARGFSLHKACLKAKRYVTQYLLSNKTLLGYHK